MARDENYVVVSEDGNFLVLYFNTKSRFLRELLERLEREYGVEVRGRVVWCG